MLRDLFQLQLLMNHILFFLQILQLELDLYTLHHLHLHLHHLQFQQVYQALLQQQHHVHVHTQLLVLSKQYLCVDKEDAKNIWLKLQPELPKDHVFRADRPSTDEDALAQDPMQIAMKAAIQEKQAELTDIKEAKTI